MPPLALRAYKSRCFILRRDLYKMASRKAAVEFGGAEKKGGVSVSSVHYGISITSRENGKLSAPGAASYRGAEKIINRRDGQIHDFSRKRGVVHKEILLPEHAPRDFAERSELWNAVEEVERQKNAQLFRHVLIGLPIELDRATHINLVRDHVQQEFVSRGMCADFFVHEKKRDGKPNPHAHIMLTMRPLNHDGTWGAKSKKEYVLDRNGQRIRLEKSGEWKSRKVTTTDWDSKENAELWRQGWERLVNREYERQGIEQHIDLRSFERQGLDKEPMIRLTSAEIALEEQGIATASGDHNRGVRERNAQREHARHIRNLDEKQITQRGQEQTPTFEEWRRGQTPQREQSRGRERGR